jgi:ribonuclease Z
MRPSFHPRLVNGPFEDPALFVEFLFEKRALLFDVGEIQALSPRRVLAVSDLFVSHTHMDHFMGFDRLVRISLGREKRLRAFGPPGFIAQVGHKLASYTWNLVENYDSDFTVVAAEIGPGGLKTAEFHTRAGFRQESTGTVEVSDGVILDEEAFRVRTAVLDHKIPCLAFSLEEKSHLNIWKNRLDEMGFPVGAWLRELKEAVRREVPDDSLFRVWWREGGEVREVRIPLGELRSRVVRVVAGQKITYVVDTVYHAENARRIVDLARGSDVLFIESTFLQEDREHAAAKYHLTAHQAGLLAREAGVKRLVPFHFSPKYAGQEERLRQEAQAAFESGGGS